MTNQPDSNLAQRVWTQVMGQPAEAFHTKASGRVEMVVQHSIQSMFGKSPLQAEKVAEMLQSVGVLRDTLAPHVNQPGVGALMDELRNLGSKLPDEGLLRNIKRMGAKFTHSDVGGEAFNLFSEALNRLRDADSRLVYDSVVTDGHRGVAQKASHLLDSIAGKAWSVDVSSGAADSRVLRLEGPATARAGSWAARVSQLGTPQKVGLAFAAVGATALAGYYLSHGREQQASQGPSI